jgi:ABC-type amino acid transport substrate-binding protein
MFRPVRWLPLLVLAIPAAAQETGTLKEIRETGEIVIGVRDASIPFSSHNVVLNLPMGAELARVIAKPSDSGDPQDYK